ncbi:HAD family hydrolase [Pontimicrobium aquaticum]|uniref:HAD family phosphatase n=1 Tax=Pontimicrobium aquaticum TaxID=2565367 RepID=A0A4U0EVW6_9FLAO|nr:HAD family phosphatase [Pontimicrobium aquaticum]TJY36096.1 HAD family phosphatase [Pontimicrobium aquaticum]
MSTIKTIIFDFGDVFINLDKPAIKRELIKLGIPKAISLDMYHIASEYEKGLISTAELITHFNEKFPNVATQDFIKAWNSIILDFPEHRLEFVEKLSKENNYQLILLSNTNDLHIEQVIKNMSLPRYKRFKNSFNKFYLSQEIHLSKPSPSIYEFVLNDNNLQARQCLFIDDLKENTESASKLGIRTWNIIPGKEDVTQLFTIKNDLF